MGGPHPSNDVKLFSRNFEFDPDTGTKTRWTSGRMKLVNGEEQIDEGPLGEHRPLTVEEYAAIRKTGVDFTTSPRSARRVSFSAHNKMELPPTGKRL